MSRCEARQIFTAFALHHVLSAWRHIPIESVVGNVEFLTNAIRRIMEGKQVFSRIKANMHKFSLRQKQMIPLFANGVPNTKIADELQINTRAVERQRREIYKKIQVRM